MKTTHRLLTLALTLLLSALGTAAHADWSPAGSLATGRHRHTATLLASGKVLVAGGFDASSSLASAELYDPATDAWSPAGSLATARRNHTATLLASGKVLVAGGLATNGYLASAELYDPVTNAWSAAGSLAAARYNFTATRLSSGKVLVVGGYNGSGDLAGAELYDPVTNAWSAAGSLITARQYHTATLLPSGKVLVAGGAADVTPYASAELYDPVTNAWSATGSLAAARAAHTATLLPSGKVLVAGGFNSYASAELYDPATNAWSAAGSLATGRSGHTATLLPSGRVLVVGGSASTELYNPASNAWNAAGNLATARGNHTATLLFSGRVLVAGGGEYGSSPLASAELYVRSLLFKKGDAVPGVAGKTFTSFGVPAINESGKVAFLGKWTGGAGVFADGALVAQVGDVLSGTAAIKLPKDPVIDDAGHVAFPCTLMGAGITTLNDAAIVSNAPGGTLAIAAQEGTQAADAPVGALWKSFTSVAAPGGGGGVLILGFMQQGTGGITATTDNGVWSADAGGVLHLVLQEGVTVIEGLTVKNFLVLKTVSGTPGQTHAFNTNAELVAKVTFTITNDQALVRLSLP